MSEITDSGIAEFDDSFIKKIHKNQLIKDINQRITTNPDYQIYDNVMLEILCNDMYSKVINGIDKEQYLREIEQEEEKESLFTFKETHLNGIVVENLEENLEEKLKVI